MKIRITLIEDMLGTASNNPDVHREFIASKAPDAQTSEEEVAALGVEAVIEKQMTVFPKDENGKPFLWDYQLKGFVKEALGIITELLDKEVRIGKTKLSKFTHKRLVDNYVFVSPRRIPIVGEMGEVCVRPLRAETMRGERVSLASSETIKAGAVIVAEIKCLTPQLDDLILQCLDYGKLKGLGCWRNSGRGRFDYQVIPNESV